VWLSREAVQVLLQGVDDERGQRDGPVAADGLGRPQDGLWDVTADQLAVDPQGLAAEVDPVEGQTARLSLPEAGADAQWNHDPHPAGQLGRDPLDQLQRDRLGPAGLALGQPGPGGRVAGQEAILDGCGQHLVQVLVHHVHRRGCEVEAGAQSLDVSPPEA